MASLLADKRTPMAWQHRDLNYHQAGYQDRYGPGLEISPGRAGPSSTSDRLSHRTDKSWRTQRDSQGAYPPSRPSYSTGRPTSRPHSTVTSSETSSSSSDGDSTQDDPRGPIPHPQQPLYGYESLYPPYGPMGAYPPSVSQYPGTIKSAKSVPTLLNTWDGEPCPVHGVGPLSLPPPPLLMPPPPRRAASIYDMRLLSPPPSGPIYGTLPVRPPGDRRSLAGPPPGIPPQLLPPMVRPRPLVVSEDGTTEPLPVRSPPDKTGVHLSLAASAKIAEQQQKDQKRQGCRGGVCVGLIVMGVISVGLMLGVLLIFIL